MTLADFVKKYEGKYARHRMGYGRQCMDLYRLYVDQVLKLPQSPPVRGAVDVWNNYLKDHYDRIPASSEGPQPGDIVIWGTEIGPYGHIAVCVTSGKRFMSFDQNYPVGSPCALQEHSLSYVKGWLRKKNTIPWQKRVNQVIRETVGREPMVKEQKYLAKRIHDGTIVDYRDLKRKANFWLKHMPRPLFIMELFKHRIFDKN